MKRLPLVAVVLGLVVAACGGDADSTTTAAPATTAGIDTTVPSEATYRIQLAVSHEEQQLDDASNRAAAEFEIVYDIDAALVKDAGQTVAATAGSVDWVVRCGQQGNDTGAELGAAELEVPTSLAEISLAVAEEFPDEPWLASAALSLHDIDGDLWIIHRFPSAVRSGRPIVCDGSTEPTQTFIPAVGAAWMGARALNVGGAPLSRADVRNLEIGSFPTTYFTEAIGGSLDESGWVIAIVRPEDVVAGPVEISFRDTREDADVEYDFVVTGRIELVP